MYVYVSYGHDLEGDAEFIKEIIRSLGLRTGIYETQATEYFDRNFFEIFQSEMDKSKLFIGIYGYYYGWIADKDYFGEDTTDGERSIFHMEYAWAKQKGLPMLLFFYDGAPKTKDWNDDIATLRGQKLKSLRDEVAKDHYVDSYSDLETLRKKVGAALIRSVHHLRNHEGKPGEMVFISHSTSDDAFVDKLTDKLKEGRLQPWVDHFHLLPGADWDTTIEHALDASDCMIVVLSPKSIKSLVVKAEWSYFGETGKKIYPILIEKTVIPFRLRVLHYLDFTDGKQKEAFERLREALGIEDADLKWNDVINS